MTHLGSQVSALADGQLGPAETERALAHVAQCRSCAEDLAAARAAHRALAAAMDVPVDPRLTARLIALGDAGASVGTQARGGPGGASRPARRGTLADASVPLPGTEGPRLPADCLHGSLLRRRRVPARVVGAALVSAGVMATGLFALGEQPVVVPEAHRAASLTLLARAPAGPVPGATEALGVSATSTSAGSRAPLSGGGTSGSQVVDLEGPAAQERVLGWLRQNGWACPDGLPEGYEVTAVRLDPAGPDTLELDLAGHRGTVVVMQQHGRLDASALRAGTTLEVEGREVHLLSSAPWHVVWQTGDTVVSVIADVPDPALAGLIAAYPDRKNDQGVPARISRGWRTVAGAWSP